MENNTVAQIYSGISFWLQCCWIFPAYHDNRRHQRLFEIRNARKICFKNIVITFVNADAERIFSKVALVKRKARGRLNTQSVNSLIALSECSSMWRRCTKFEINESMAACIEWLNFSI